MAVNSPIKPPIIGITAVSTICAGVIMAVTGQGSEIFNNHIYIIVYNIFSIEKFKDKKYDASIRAPDPVCLQFGYCI